MNQLRVRRFKPISTGEGWLFPVWRSYDDEFVPPGFESKFVYVSTMRPQTKKGIIVHTRRVSVVCMLGAAESSLEVCNPGGTVFQEIMAEDPETQMRSMVMIPPGFGVLYKNPSLTEEVQVLVTADIAWTPAQDDTFKFQSWEDYDAWSLSKGPEIKT